MPEPTTPTVRGPEDGSTVDGLAVTLSWEPVRAARHRVQVAADDRFDALVVDADAGSSDSLTLYELLPRDGRRLHWRVGAEDSGSTHWSEPAWFLSADMVDRPPAPPRPAAARPVSADPPSEAAEEPLYLRATTGSGEVAVAVTVLLLTIAALVIAAF